MYRKNLKKRQNRIQNQTHHHVTDLPSASDSLFGPSFMDNLQVEYPTHEFSDIQWDPELRVSNGWEKQAS